MCLTITLCVFFQNISAQNLVPNESFENYNACPFGNSSIPFSPGYDFFPFLQEWTSPVKFATPDYFHICAAPELQVPANVHGSIWPKTGDAYAGIIAFENEGMSNLPPYDYREYLQVKLLEPMQAGKQYCVKFFVSPGISSYFSYNYTAINEVGAHVSVTRPVELTQYTLPLTYHIRSDASVFMSDTTTWYSIQGIYTAIGGEEWLTLGCFQSSIQPTTIHLYPQVANVSLPSRAYLYIDDVTVYEITPSDTISSRWDTLVCDVDHLNITLHGPQDALDYEWNTMDITSSISVKDTGVYWCVSRLECGLAIDTYYVHYKTPNVLDLGRDTVNCFLQPILLQPNYSYDTYSWNTGDITPQIWANTSGTYILTVSDTCGMQKDSIQVTIQSPTPPIDPIDTTICQFSVSPRLLTDYENITWYVDVHSEWGISVQPYMYTSEVGTQTLYVTQTIGECESEKSPVQIHVRYKPKVEIGDYILLCEGQDTLIGTHQTDVFYLWNTGENICCIKPERSGIYILTLLNDCGTDTDSLQVDISPCDDCIAFPTAFTPNNDGRNDKFTAIEYCPVDNFSLTIYNRWGEKIYYTEDVFSGWDGTYKGIGCDMGVYVFMVNYTSSETKRRKHVQGNVTLIR